MDTTEVELKFHLAREAANEFARVKSLHAVRPTERHEVTRYFDTPDLLLAAEGLSLRVRSRGQERIQTLKSTLSVSDLAARRGEWEWAIGQAEPELGLLSDTPAAKLLSQIQGRLGIVFLTDIQRQTRLHRLADETEVESAYDRGRIVSDSESVEVDELELELKSGTPGALYRFAIAVHEVVPMWLAPSSKAERGYRLRTGLPPEATRAPKLTLDKDIAVNVAFHTIVGSSLGAILANVAPVEAGEPEGVHQVRVGLRRLRSALVLFAPMLERNTADRFADELGRLGRVFGARRDYDVFCLDTLPAAAESGASEWVGPLRERAERRREDLYASVVDALHGRGLTGLALGLAAWCEDGLSRPELLGGPFWAKRLDAVAPDLLDRLARMVKHRAKRLGEPERLHDLRKSVKKLRYAVEFVGGLYAGDAMKAHRRRCEALQEELGTINDARVTTALAGQLIDENGVALAPAVAALAGWAGERERKALNRLDDALREFLDTPPFWHGMTGAT